MKKNEKFINVGRRNNIYQRVIVLKTNRQKRYSYGEIFVEGVNSINLALKYNWKVKHWICSSNKLSNWAKDLIKNHITETNYCFTEELMKEISDKTSTSEIMAIFEMKKIKIELSDNPFIVLCDRPSKKGNLGTIIRSADAFGCDGVVVTGHAVDIYDPEVIAATTGSYFAVNVQKLNDNNSIREFISELKEKYPNLVVVATAENGAITAREFDFNRPVLLLAGNETNGLSRFYLDLCDALVKIPMVGDATSLNVANATSIFLYEIFAQRNI